MIFVELFITFFFIGLFTIGGGYAMLSLIQTQVVNVHQWIDYQTFTDIVAVSQMTPGPIGINSATYIGYDVVRSLGYSEFVSILGSATATFAVILPSFLIVLTICKMIKKFASNKTFHFVLTYLKATVIGLIGAAAIMLMNPENFIDWKSWLIFAIVMIVTLIKKISPILILVLSGIVGYIIY